ncbi:alpha/beta fold hydrolase [Nocardia sp. NPDC057353]|uniref:alpha/beta fold hydrolase n=1 Tax=Nocardia sp. NPDC057353 TaxID=3346104 RepID=UPI0036431081
MVQLGRFRSPEGERAYERAYRRALAEGPEPSGIHDVPTSYGTVRTYTWHDGTADPVVLLPGRSSGAPMWSAHLPALDRPLVALDAIGDAGLSVQTAPLTSMADQARWVDEALAALGCGRVHLLGHSFGGATATAVALHAPHRLASLLLVEPVFTLRLPPPATFFWATVATLPGRRAWREYALAAIGGVPVAELRAATPVGEMIRIAAEQYRGALPVPRPLGDAELAALAGSTYIAVAERSLAGGERAVRRAATAAIEAELWPGTTHSLPMQVPDELAARLRAFLGALP